MIKRKYLAACLVAALFVAGCGSNSAEKKETTETKEETKQQKQQMHQIRSLLLKRMHRMKLQQMIVVKQMIVQMRTNRI